MAREKGHHRLGIFLVAGIMIMLLSIGLASYLGSLTTGAATDDPMAVLWVDPDPTSSIPLYQQASAAAPDPLATPTPDPLTPVCPVGMTVVTSIDGTEHGKGTDGYIYEFTPPGQTPARSPDKYQWLGDHPPGSASSSSSATAGAGTHNYVIVPDGTYQTVEPSANGIIPANIASKMRPPHLSWKPPAYTSTKLPAASLVIDSGESVSRVNDVSAGQMVIVRGDHSSETITVTKPIILKGEDGAVVKGIDIRAPCIVTGFSVTGREVGIFASGVTGSDQYPFIIEGCHCYWNGYGLRLYYCNNVIIKNNYLESNSEIELHIEHMSNGKIIGNNLGEETYQPGGGSVDVDGAALRYLTDCRFEDNYIGEHYYGTRWYSGSNCIIKNNVYRNSGTNLRLGKEYNHGDYGQCENMQVIGNDIQGGTDAIWAQACVNCVFNDNIMKSKYGFKSGMGQGGSGSGNVIERVVPSYG